MDVTANTFQSLLPSILQAITSARFVAFDLELSGIPLRQIGKTRSLGGKGDGKSTLQERYEETKRAAEQYQILQLGLTCVEEDKECGAYVLRPYNFYLNPLVNKKLEVNRDFTFQSGAVDFLLGIGFQIDAPFRQGVPYLSRVEEAQARELAISRWNRTRLPDIKINDSDIDAITFLQKSREDIESWIRKGKPEGYLNIPSIDQSSSNFTRGLNRFQKRLIHQLVRKDFADLISIAKNEFIQLYPFDQTREDKDLEKKKNSFEVNLTSQVGLRWVAEALCPDINQVIAPQHAPPNASGNLDALSSWSLPPAMRTEEESELYTCQFSELTLRLSQRRTTLVGHNVFLDLIYFYKCFFGALPDRVEEFQRLMSRLFPLIFDTKYLADILNDNSSSYKSSLEDLDRELRELPFPLIEVAPGHEKYASDSPIHEAGFDSFLTAKVLIRLAARIETTGSEDNVPNSEDEAYVTASESEEGGVPLGDLTNMSASSPRVGRSAFSHSNPYASLQDLNVKDDDPDLPSLPESSPLVSAHKMMPPQESHFWTKYGNKLRINGTHEGVCPIGRMSREDASSRCRRGMPSK